MAQIAEPVWIEAELALAIHDRQLAEHGGPIGVRDASALESALGRPRNQWAYGEADLCALAAAYAYGVARNHPFVDGNKRNLAEICEFGEHEAICGQLSTRRLIAIVSSPLQSAWSATWHKIRTGVAVFLAMRSFHCWISTGSTTSPRAQPRT